MKNSLLKKLCAVSLAAFMLVGTGVAEIGSFVGTGVEVSAAATSARSFEYSENSDGGITIKKFTGSEKDVVIPGTISGKKVTSIEDDAFEYCSDITSVTIPDGVTRIGTYAFSWCESLKTVNIPDSVTSIGDFTFEFCSSLTSVNIPNSVTSIGYFAFYSCSSLTSVTIPDSITNIERYAFACCNLTSIKVSKNNNCYSSKDGILYDKNKTTLIVCPQRKKTVTIPDSVTSITEYAFNNCSILTSVTIPNSVTSIDYRTFTGSSSFIIFANKGSYAESYAKYHGIRFATNNIVYGESADIVCTVPDYNKYTYAVYYKQSTATKWTTAQNYSENTEVIFKPKHTGTYNVCIRAKDENGKVTKTNFDITVNPSLRNTSAVSANSVKLGEKVNVTAASTGGLGEKVYEVYYKNSTQTKWTKAQSYSSNTSLTIKPRHTGTYTICVKAKDERGKVVKKNLTVEVTK